ncbi:hypothetical protein V6N13_005866 [Hibiscus sabdariffa]|uniref:Uncharacterized protein n=1 Tax=Hibiscus sabdariffa TaxID=183260 RepID=A0ABR2EPX3_9ROSI
MRYRPTSPVSRIQFREKLIKNMISALIVPNPPPLAKHKRPSLEVGGESHCTSKGHPHGPVLFPNEASEND